MAVRSFVQHHYRHFNALALRQSADAYLKLLDNDGVVLMTLAGAMSTAELGLSLAEMIRQEKVHAICCTGANLEEDVFNLVAHDHYEVLPNYRDLSPQQEAELYDRGMNRVTDTCIPEEEAMRRIEKVFLGVVKDSLDVGQKLFPHEVFYRMLRTGQLEEHYQIDPNDSWLVAAAERNLPMYVPGWEDSTLGNMLVAWTMHGQFAKDYPDETEMPVKTGLHYMRELIEWYGEESKQHPVGFFQIGGGIAGDFPICVVPLMIQDLKEQVPFWSYFCQISDSTTSFGSYSGAVPNEKITWGKLAPNTPRFVIESDATIVAPLLFGYVLDW
jgi:deoxyhypusine synthase